MKPYWTDGKRTIYHGDARDILPTFAAGSFDCVWMDPPYGHNNNNGDLIQRREAALGRPPCAENPALARPIANDGAEANDLVKFAFAECARLLAPGCCCCCCCCCGGGGPDPQFARWSLWLDEVLDFKQMVVWDKGPMGMGWHYRRSYETVLVAEKPGAACRWFDDTNRVENIIRHLPKIIPQKHHHPTSKPTELAHWFLKLHCKTDDLVLDPFCGGGCGAEASKELNLRYIGIDVSEEFCAMTVRRLKQECFEFTE